jgi:hypothetical protein
MQNKFLFPAKRLDCKFETCREVEPTSPTELQPHSNMNVRKREGHFWIYLWKSFCCVIDLYSKGLEKGRSFGEEKRRRGGEEL